MLRIQSLGATMVLVGDARLDPSAGTLFAVLVRTVYSPGTQVGRDVLLRSLWAGQPESRQRANLRQALYKLRLMGVRIGLTGEVVELEAAQLTPVFALERTARRFDEDVTRGHEPFGVFLPGYRTGSAEYDEWLAVQREAVHADVRRVLVEQLSARRQRADWTGADALARWLLQFDPLNEEATFTVAECLAMNGSKVEALALLDRYRDDLGPDATELRLNVNLLRRRVSEPHRHGRTRASFAPTERHFVGRETLMAELTLAMRRTRWRDGSALLLHGAPGMGKTRVTQELGKVAAIEGFRVIATDCREGDQRRPLSVFLDLIPELLEMPGAAACDPASMRVLKRLVRETAGNPLQDAAAKGDATADPIDAERAAGLHREPLPLPSVLRRSIVDLVNNVCLEHPTLLVAENLHWVDELSASVFADLVTASPNSRYFILATSRVPTTPVLAPVLAAGMHARTLQPLSNESARRLALAICADLDTDCGDEVHEWFIRASEGTPLFLRALVTHWIDTGSAGGVPPTLAALIDQRLAALSDDALRTVQAAALLGRHANASTVTAVLEFSTIRMIGALDELATAGAYTLTGDAVIAFHELVARAALQKLSVPSTRLLHARAATVLQASRVAGEDATPVDIVEHLREGGGDAALVEYAVRAASGYLREGLPHRALAVCEAAQRSRGEAAEWEELSRLEVASLYAAGQHAKVIERLPKPSRDQLDPTWDEQHAEDVLHFVDSIRHAPIVENSPHPAARATLLAECPRLAPALRLQAAGVAIKVATYCSDPTAAQRAFEAGLMLASSASDDGRSKHELEMFFHTEFGDSSTARLAALSLADRVESYENRSARILMRGSIGYGLRVNGAPARAYEQYISAFQEAVAAQMVTTAAIAAWNASLIAFDHFDDTDLAEDWLERPECRAPEIGKQRAAVVLQQNRVRLAILRSQGNVAEAELLILPRNSADLHLPFRAAYFRAIELGSARVNENANALDQLLPEAVRLLASTRRMVGQDFFVSQIVSALIFLDRVGEAVLVLRDYLRDGRRHHLAIPRYLMEQGRRLNVSMLSEDYGDTK